MSVSDSRASPDFAVFDLIPVGLFVVDGALVIRSWNLCLENWTRRSRTEVVGLPLGSLAAVWELPHYRQRLASIFEGGPPVLFSPLLHPGLLPRASGPQGVFNLKVTPLPCPEGGYWALISCEDVTDLNQRIGELKALHHQSQLEVEARRTAEALLQKALGERELLIREIHHRVKNNLNLVAGLIELQVGHASQEVQPVLSDLRQRIYAISQIHDVLYKSSDLELGPVGNYLGPLAKITLETLSRRGEVELTTDFAPGETLNTDDTIILGLIQTELLTNSLKHGLGPRGTTAIRLRVHRAGNELIYTMEQEGDSLPEGFDPDSATGLGMQLLGTYGEQLKGRFQWTKGDPTVIAFSFLHRG